LIEKVLTKEFHAANKDVFKARLVVDDRSGLAII
jgi:hypothetical protein